uniref:Uncharacterized protein n=1 Tax=Anguilla anguilla TaxID=7936 RepID=A0A0E9SUQ5_ANGAN
MVFPGCSKCNYKNCRALVSLGFLIYLYHCTSSNFLHKPKIYCTFSNVIRYYHRYP